MSRITQPLKWFGGKHYLAPWIHSLAPPHKHRVYLYAGGLGEAWNWPCEGVSEVANDVNGYLVNFYRVLRDREAFAEFSRLVAATPFSRDEWGFADEMMTRVMGLCGPAEFTTSDPWSPDVRIAWMFFTWNRQSWAGQMETFATLSKSRTRRGMNEQTSAWWGTVEGLQQVHERLKRIVIEHDDALRVIDREDTEGTCFYADPTYTMGSDGEGRSTPDVYQCETDVAHHVALADRLAAGVRGKVMLSGYRNEIYESRLTAERGWVRHEKEIDNKASGGKTKRVMTECLWCNF